MRLLSLYIAHKQWSFNPRICKRCDGLVVCGWCDGSGFNPRICKRCDGLCTEDIETEEVSIHASVKDATVPNGVDRDLYVVSIHASVKDATICC